MRTLLLCLTLLVTFGLENAKADHLELVRYTNMWTQSPARSADTSGITYLADRGHLLVADSEISEYGEQVDPATGNRVFAGVNIFEVSLDAADLYGKWNATPPDSEKSEPVGIAWHPGDGHVYITDDDEKRIFRYVFSAQRAFGRPLSSALTSIGNAYTDPEGIAVDPATGDLLVVSGTRNERVLRFHYDAGADRFDFVSEFAVGDHISDPEGIAVHPISGHVFTIASEGIAEFTASGEFVQRFDYGFLEVTGVVFRLPGGGTFAPSSDPNDDRDRLSLYVTCRGIDNGRFPDQNSLDGGLAELRIVRKPTLESPLRIPADYPTIQAAIDTAKNGDTILVAPGVYKGSVDLGVKQLNLVSEHFLTGDPKMVEDTVIDGQGGDFVLRIGDPERPSDGGSLMHGFTLRNADDGIDLDGSTAVVIEQCELVGNGDDGIEVRLQPHAGPEILEIVVRDNLIAKNGEDGIQLIGYDQETARRFLFEGNRIVGNAMAGVGLMSGANTREDYEAAPLPERLVVVHNTFVDNDHHITGGARALIANNVFVRARRGALKNQVRDSLVKHNLLWQNAAAVNGETQMQDPINAPPGFVGERFSLGGDSGAVDAGLRRVKWLGVSWTLLPPAEVRGQGPDLGALEHWQSALVH